MPTTGRDGDEVSVDDRPREKHRRSKSERKTDRDGDRERDRERKHRHRSSKSTKTKQSTDGGAGSDTLSQGSTKRYRRRRDKERDGSLLDHKERSASASDLGSKMWSAISLDRPRVPYPTFSKAHSKEAVMSREDVSGKRQSNPLTPETTDFGEDERRSKSADLDRKPSISKKARRPPTPPDTDVSADKRQAEDQEGDRQEGTDIPERPKSRVSGVSRSGSLNETRSKVSRKSGSSSQATYVKNPTHKSHDKLRAESRTSNRSRESLRRSSSRRSSKQTEGPDADSSPSSAQPSSPRTPTQAPQFPSSLYADHQGRSSASPAPDDELNYPSKTATPASQIPAGPMPPPPPPPPPAVDIHDVPRVDYLLQNGGLAYPAPKNFLAVLPRLNGTRPSQPPLAGADTLFAPFFNLLDQYNTVLTKQGSVAVATGHRSVARRLLDRLEHVFSRDLPQNGCSCVMCEKSHEIHHGLTWGDVLEWVSGRIELPQWPPFNLADIGTKAAEISGEEPPRPASPVKLDPDIAEEFRDHYLRQSKKVRSAVDHWLSKTGETPVPPPQDVDDETLTFAIMTNLNAADRPYFNAVLSGSRELRPATRAPTPLNKMRTDLIVKCGLSLQRLYRLSQVPRDAETAAYLIKNQHTHDLLVTISNINNSEWEILTSGRFDGFLWSGADGEGVTPGAESRGTTPANAYFGSGSPMSPGTRGASAMGSRTTTPFSMQSRDTTPASFTSRSSSVLPGGRHPVSNDEEMEMAAIAEIEREIYTGMERLEDAFEKLHQRAEVVRTALRQRGAGLMQSFQSRRHIDVLPNHGPGTSHTPGFERSASAWGHSSEIDPGSDSEWCMDDVDLAPDDSASNISSSRHRRPKRRTERRTPAPIEEEDERW